MNAPDRASKNARGVVAARAAKHQTGAALNGE